MKTRTRGAVRMVFLPPTLLTSSQSSGAVGQYRAASLTRGTAQQLERLPNRWDQHRHQRAGCKRARVSSWAVSECGKRGKGQRPASFRE